MTGLRAYTSILLPDAAWRFSLAAWFARLYRVGTAVGVIMLVVAASDDYAIAGVAGGATVVASAIAAPAWSLAADRVGQERVIPLAVLAMLVTTALLIVAVETGAPRWTWIVASGLAGVSILDAGAIVRARWLHRLTDVPSRQSALALESVSDELAFLLGLPIVALAAGLVGPAAALAGAAVLSGLGFIALMAMRSSAPPVANRASPDRVSGLRAWLPPGVLAPLPAFVGIGTVFGTMNLAGVAVTEAAGRPGLAGVVIAAFSVGAVLAALVVGAVARAWSMPRRMALAAGLFAVVSPALLFVREPVGFAIGVAVIGLGAGALLVGAFGAVESRSPASAMTVAMAWPPVAMSLGNTIGAILAGTAIDAGGASTVWWIPVVGAGLGLVGLAAVVAAVRSDRRAPASPSVPVAAEPV